MGAVAVVFRTLVGAILSGGVENQDVHDILQVPLHHRSVQSTAFVRSLNAAQVPVGPVDVVAILGQAKRMRKIIGHYLPLQT